MIRAGPQPLEGLGWAGEGCRGWGLGWAGLGAGLDSEICAFENGKVLSPSKEFRSPDGQQQQAISIYFFLEGFGFRALRRV